MSESNYTEGNTMEDYVGGAVAPEATTETSTPVVQAPIRPPKSRGPGQYNREGFMVRIDGDKLATVLARNGLRMSDLPNVVYAMVREQEKWSQEETCRRVARAAGCTLEEIERDRMPVVQWLDDRAAQTGEALRRHHRAKRRSAARMQDTTERKPNPRLGRPTLASRGTVVEFDRALLRSAITLSGRTQEAIADQAGITRGMLGHYVNATKQALKTMPIERMKALAAALGIKPDVLVTKVHEYVAPPPVRAMSASAQPRMVSANGLSTSKSALAEVERAINRGAEVVVVVIRK